MKQAIFSVLVLLLPALAWTSGTGHHGAIHIPWGLVIPQILNFAIAVGLLIYFVRKPVKNYFKVRNESFLTKLSEASVAREKAEAKNAEWKNKMAKLESTSESSLIQATSDAEEMGEKLVIEAKKLSERLLLEAEKSGEYELERVRIQLKDELLVQAVAMAKTELSDGIKSPEQDRLQSEFVQKIQAVV